ncbi:MAG TPA: hypothetical protein VMF13_07425 [Luteitalea sp.]|nr:hypothetical protein [Luteitalea sp.]
MARRPPDDTPIVDSTAAITSLYQAPFADFVSMRTSLVAQLKKTGHKEVAARLAVAAKPSRAAWLVNQVYWRARKTYDAVLDAGTAARTVQQARLLGQDSADLSDTLARRDQAVRAAVTRAEAIARDAGDSASEAVLAQVRASFEAIAAHGADGRLAHGLLTTDVELPGLAALAGLVLPETPAAPVRRFEVVSRRAAPGSGAPTVPAKPDPRIAQAEARVAELLEREGAVTERVAELERGLAAAAERLTAAEAAVAAATREMDAARSVVEAGTRSRDAVTRDLAEVARDRKKAQAALEKLQPRGQ